MTSFCLSLIIIFNQTQVKMTCFLFPNYLFIYLFYSQNQILTGVLNINLPDGCTDTIGYNYNISSTH